MAWLLYWSALYTACLIASLLLHELGHALAAKALGVEFKLGLTSVVSDADSNLQKAAIAAAGPAFSALQGILAVALLLFIGDRSATMSQICIFMGGLGFSVALGYLLTTPFLTTGDLGKVAMLLGFPLWLKIAIAIAGAIGITLLARWVGNTQLALLPANWRAMSAPVAFFLGGVVPWLISVPIVMVLMGPVSSWLSLLFPFFAGYYLLIAWMDRPDWARASGFLAAATSPVIPMALGLAALMILLAIVIRRHG